MSKLTDARSKATEIQNERLLNKNKAERVGKALHGVLDAVEDGDANLQSQLNLLSAGYLGAIAYNDAAPTPTQSGYYEFSSAGVCSWLAGTPTVKVGDRVSVKFTAPSTYVRTLISADMAGSDLYNVTVKVPLASGQFYTTTTARAAVPANIKKLGLKITYATSAGVWVAEQYVGSDVSGWADADSWKTSPETSSMFADKLYIVDASGNVIASIDANGVNSRKYNICNSQGQIVSVVDAEVLESLIDASSKIGGFQAIQDALSTDVKYYGGFYVVDQRTGKPFVGLKYDDNGLDAAMISDHFKSLINASAPTASSVKMTGEYNADINLCVIYGQSLAVGGTTMTEDFYTALQFQQGVMIAPNTSTSLANMNSEVFREPLFGNITQMGNGSGLNGRIITKKWNELLVSENGKTLEDFNFNLMGFVAGVSGGQWYQLAKQSYGHKYVNDAVYGVMPTAINFGVNLEGFSYLNLVQGIYFANKKVLASGKTFNVPVLCWVQGEASSDKADTIATYESKLLQIFGDLNMDIKAITGQSNDVQFIIYQNSSFAIYQVPTSPSYIPGGYFEGVPLACLKVAREQSNVRFGCPLYPYSPSQDSGDKLHLSNAGYTLMSSNFAVQAKRAITDKSEKIVFYPSNILISNNSTNYFVRVKFDVPVKPLVIDTTGDDGLNMHGHGLQPNYGFSILNGSTEIITSVRLSGEDTVVLTCSENPSGKSLTYALTGVLGGGNLRDSQGDSIKTTFSNTQYRVDNWCPFFRITI